MSDNDPDYEGEQAVAFLHMNQRDNAEIGNEEESEDRWDVKSVNTLLNGYLRYKDKFRNPKIKKKALWDLISAEVGHPPMACDKKFRNLKLTYLRVLKKRSIEGEAVIRWPFFNIFEEIFNIDGQYTPDIEQKLQEPNVPEVKGDFLLNPATGYVYENVNSEDQPEECYTEDDIGWTFSRQMTLLDNYTAYIDEFRNPASNELDLWDLISSSVGLPTHECMKKFRYMKSFYIKLLRRLKKEGGTEPNWKFFHVFENIFKVDGEYLPEIHEKVKDLDKARDGSTDAKEKSAEFWDHNATTTLLQAYMEKLENFRNPKIKKKSLWKEISKIVGEPAPACDVKFRNLKITYIRILEKNKQHGETRSTWPYFNTFEKIFNEDGNFQLTDRNDQSVEEAGTSANTEDFKPRTKRRKFIQFRKVATAIQQRQKTVEAKLDKLISVVQESNEIQRKRNDMFLQYVEEVYHEDV